MAKTFLRILRSTSEPILGMTCANLTNADASAYCSVGKTAGRSSLYHFTKVVVKILSAPAWAMKTDSGIFTPSNNLAGRQPKCAIHFVPGVAFTKVMSGIILCVQNALKGRIMLKLPLTFLIEFDRSITNEYRFPVVSVAYWFLGKVYWLRRLLYST